MSDSELEDRDQPMTTTTAGVSSPSSRWGPRVDAAAGSADVEINGTSPRDSTKEMPSTSDDNHHHSLSTKSVHSPMAGGEDLVSSSKGSSNHDLPRSVDHNSKNGESHNLQQIRSPDPPRAGHDSLTSNSSQFRRQDDKPSSLSLEMGKGIMGQGGQKRSHPSPRTPPSIVSKATTTTPLDEASVGAVVPPEKCLSDFRLLEEVEWGPRQDEDGYDSDQSLAPRPKNRVTSDICSCHLPPPGQKWTCRSDDCINYACREECRKHNCVEQCGNQRISRREFKQVEVFDAGPKGYGLRVLEDCVKGDIIQEYTGQAVREKSLAKLFRTYQHERRLYIMALDDKVYLDAKKAGGWARFINHSCNPNCKVEKWRVKGVYRAAVVALRDIKAGTELTFDYQWSRKIGRAPTKCYCGDPACRGTLELSKTVEEVQLERLLSGNWIRPKHKKADERIVNRTIRIKQQLTGNDGDTTMQDDQPFYLVAEITEYNYESNLHKILYSNLEERWENLNSNDLEWMLLDEELSPSRANAIARKAPPQATGPGPVSTTSLDAANKGRDGGTGGSLLTAFSATEEQKINEQLFYLYIQTPIKEAMFTQSNSLKERVERNCQVCITLQQQARPPLNCNVDDPEDVAKFAALDESFDGTVWKVSIAGSDKDVAKAHATLSKNVQYWQKRRQQGEQNLMLPTPGLAVVSTTITTGDSSKVTDEVVFPRALVDHVKRKLPSVRERCRNVSIQIAPSESKSKIIARLLLEGSLQSDLQHARIHIRNAIVAICKELPTNDQLPMVQINNGERIPRVFGCLGGSLSREEFESLLQNSSKFLGRKSPSTKVNPLDPASALIRSKQKGFLSASQDLNQSPFFTTFESLYGPVWVQSEDDMGRINGKHQLVGDSGSIDRRKVYLGCEPKDIQSRWEIIQKRARDVMRGVRFLHLGTDQIYHRFLVMSQFFNFVEATTGTSVVVDQVTGNHLQLEGTSRIVDDSHLPEQVQGMTATERADFAEELLLLQIEVYRDQFTRSNSWIFGRDWTTINLVNEEPVPDSMKQIAASFGQLDIRSAPHSCVEMAEVVAHLELPCFVAAHAAVILYRFVSVVSETQMKARDSVLACVFIANKAQKCKRWKRLDAVLEAGYKAFYPGTHFDAEKEEVNKLEQRVVAAEQELLAALQYDVFVRDMDSLEQAVSPKGKFVDSVFNFAFSGQVLGAGAQLWLKYGIDYVFASAAAILKADLQKVVTTLGLIPLKVAQAVKLMAENARYGKPASDKVPSNPLLEGGKVRLEKYIPRIDEACVELTAEMTNKQIAQPEMSSSNRLRYLELAKGNLCVYAVKGVAQEVVANHILPHVDGIEAESGCSIFLCPSKTIGAEDIRIQGHWRTVAIADHLLRTSAAVLSNLPHAEDEMEWADSSTQLQVKTTAGLIDAREICTSGGWEGTLHPLGSKEHAERQLGGKSCMAGKISVDVLKNSGLRWWIRRTEGLFQTDSFTEIFSIRYGDGNKLEKLANLALLMDDDKLFPTLSSFKEQTNHDETKEEGPYIAVSLQRWPSEKVSAKEQKRSRKSKQKSLTVGFSAGALQEMQLLTMLHKLVPSPHGHPNVILPVAIAVPVSDEQIETPTTAPEGDDPMFSLFKTTQENETAATKEKTVKSSPHLVFQPCPFVLQRFLSRKNCDVDILEAQTVLASWFNDLVSAIVHCHCNNVVLRCLHPDQVVIDHSGIAKLSGFYRATILESEDRRHPPNMLNIIKEMKKKGILKKKDEEDDMSTSPFAPPEILLGSPKFTKESDIWILGCVLANILLSKPPFVGKDRQSLLSSMYKIVGIPGEDNFEQAARFPYYVKPTKRYKRGVEKAMEHMLKNEQASKYTKAIDLVAKMLHLNPADRCTAEEALDHEFLREYRESSKEKSFRESYVAEWTALKSKIIKCAKYSNGASSMQSERRRALMLATATGADSNDENEDGLYDFEV
ncbi:hypothetical protein ACA910_000577 [Epithemia clementina (nom. ined.)]